MAHEAPLRATEHGLVPEDEGWFVVSARDARWYHAEGRSAVVDFEGDTPFPHLGINLSVLEPGQSMGMYHWEADQEDFLVLAGEPLLIVEGVERRLAPWDFVHCPPGTAHIIVGAGTAPSLVLAVGARERSTGESWGAYTVEPLAQRHGVGVEAETTDPATAYAGLPRRRPVRYREGWLPR